MYWVTSAAFGLVQTWVLDWWDHRRRRARSLPPAAAEAATATPTPPPPAPDPPGSPLGNIEGLSGSFSRRSRIFVSVLVAMSSDVGCCVGWSGVVSGRVPSSDPLVIVHRSSFICLEIASVAFSLAFLGRASVKVE